MEPNNFEILPTLSDDPHKLLGQIRHFVMRCHSVLKEGKEPNLIGMESQVKILCDQIHALEVEEAQQLRPRLDSLVEELDELTLALKKQKELVQRQLEELTRQHRASNAYQKVGASVPLKTEDED